MGKQKVRSAYRAISKDSDFQALQRALFREEVPSFLKVEGKDPPIAQLHVSFPEDYGAAKVRAMMAGLQMLTQRVSDKPIPIVYHLPRGSRALKQAKIFGKQSEKKRAKLQRLRAEREKTRAKRAVEGEQQAMKIAMLKRFHAISYAHWEDAKLQVKDLSEAAGQQDVYGEVVSFIEGQQKSFAFEAILYKGKPVDMRELDTLNLNDAGFLPGLECTPQAGQAIRDSFKALEDALYLRNALQKAHEDSLNQTPIPSTITVIDRNGKTLTTDKPGELTHKLTSKISKLKATLSKASTKRREELKKRALEKEIGQIKSLSKTEEAIFDDATLLAQQVAEGSIQLQYTQKTHWASMEEDFESLSQLESQAREKVYQSVFSMNGDADSFVHPEGRPGDFLQAHEIRSKIMAFFKEESTQVKQGAPPRQYAFHISDLGGLLEVQKAVQAMKGEKVLGRPFEKVISADVSLYPHDDKAPVVQRADFSKKSPKVKIQVAGFSRADFIAIAKLKASGVDCQVEFKAKNTKRFDYDLSIMRVEKTEKPKATRCHLVNKYYPEPGDPPLSKQEAEAFKSLTEDLAKQVGGGVMSRRETQWHDNHGLNERKDFYHPEYQMGKKLQGAMLDASTADTPDEAGSLDFRAEPLALRKEQKSGALPHQDKPHTPEQSPTFRKY